MQSKLEFSACFQGQCKGAKKRLYSSPATLILAKTNSSQLLNHPGCFAALPSLFFSCSMPLLAAEGAAARPPSAAQKCPAQACSLARRVALIWLFSLSSPVQGKQCRC